MPRVAAAATRSPSTSVLAAQRSQRRAVPQRPIGPEMHLAAAQEPDPPAAGVREHVARGVVGGGQRDAVDAGPFLQVVEDRRGPGVGDVGGEAVERGQHPHQSQSASATTPATSTSSSTRTYSALECACAKSPGP